MFRRNIHHHQGELVCPLFTTGYSYEAINYGFYISYFVNCKCTTVYTMESIFIQWLKSQMWHHSAIVKNPDNLWS